MLRVVCSEPVPEFDFRSIGRRDLDPLGGMGMGGGSLFEFENRRRRRLDQGPGVPEPLPKYVQARLNIINEKRNLSLKTFI